jgi:transposase
MQQTARVRISREQTRRIAAITREAEKLKRELRDLVRAQRPELLAETGCGPLCAAILIGQTAGAQRFPSDAHFARTAGVAPIPVSSVVTSVTVLTVAATASSTGRCTSSRSPVAGSILRPALICSARKPRARAAWRRCVASSATSHATTTDCSCGHRRTASVPHQPLARR